MVYIWCIKYNVLLLIEVYISSSLVKYIINNTRQFALRPCRGTVVRSVRSGVRCALLCDVISCVVCSMYDAAVDAADAASIVSNLTDHLLVLCMIA